MYNFRTDMADERHDIYKKTNNLVNIPGIETHENIIDNNIKTNIVKIVDSEGEKAIGKPVGTYVTIDIKNLKPWQKLIAQVIAAIIAIAKYSEYVYEIMGAKFPITAPIIHPIKIAIYTIIHLLLLLCIRNLYFYRIYLLLYL